MKLFTGLLLVGLTYASWVPVQAAVDWQVSISSSPGFSVGVREYYQVPEPEWVWLQQASIAEDEWPVVLEIARQAQVAPDVVLQLRRRGWSWMDISLHLGVYADRYYVPVSFAEPRGPYWHTYRYYRQWPRSSWSQIRFSDDEFVALINLRFVAGHYHYRPEQIVRWRHTGRDWGWIYRQPRAVSSYRPDWGWQSHRHSHNGHFQQSEWRSSQGSRIGESRWQQPSVWDNHRNSVWDNNRRDDDRNSRWDNNRRDDDRNSRWDNNRRDDDRNSRWDNRRDDDRNSRWDNNRRDDDRNSRWDNNRRDDDRNSRWDNNRRDDDRNSRWDNNRRNERPATEMRIPARGQESINQPAARPIERPAERLNSFTHGDAAVWKQANQATGSAPSRVERPRAEQGNRPDRAGGAQREGRSGGRELPAQTVHQLRQ